MNLESFLRKCLTCETDLVGKNQNKFCSRSCAASYNNRGVCRVAKRNTRLCFSCEKERPQNKNKFCNTCITNGEHLHTVKDLKYAMTDRTRKHVLIRETGHFCYSCKNTTWLDKTIPIELNHIDGNSENNERENLELLCPNCHALTPNYKNKNMGNGRHYRRERYKNGQSY